MKGRQLDRLGSYAYVFIVTKERVTISYYKPKKVKDRKYFKAEQVW